MFDDIVEKISNESGTDKKEVLKLIDDKKAELSDMLSREQAASIVAQELGVKLMRSQPRLDISNIVPGMQNMEIVGKIQRIMPVHEFDTEKAKGKVMNIILADSTGSVRMSLWNEEIDKFDMNEGDVVRVSGYVKKDNMGNPELRLGRYGEVGKSDSQIDVTSSSAGRSGVSNLTEGQYAEIRAPVIQVFESNVFYEICPECGKSLKEAEEVFECEEHGEVQPDYGMVLKGVADDGTDYIRIVMFNEQAEKILGMDVKEAKKLFDRKKKMSAVLNKVPLGKEFVFSGRVKRNKIFDRSEFVVNSVKNVDTKKEIKKLLRVVG